MTKVRAKPQKADDDTLTITAGELSCEATMNATEDGEGEPAEDELVIITAKGDHVGFSVRWRGREIYESLPEQEQLWIDAFMRSEERTSRKIRDRLRYLVAEDILRNLGGLILPESLPCADDEEETRSWICGGGGVVGDATEAARAAFTKVAEGGSWDDAARTYFDVVVRQLREWMVDSYSPDRCPICESDEGKDVPEMLERLAARIRDRKAQTGKTEES